MRVYAGSRFDSQRSASGPGGAHGAAHWTGDGAQLGVAMTGCGIMAVCVVSVSFMMKRWFVSTRCITPFSTPKMFRLMSPWAFINWTF